MIAAHLVIEEQAARIRQLEGQVERLKAQALRAYRRGYRAGHTKGTAAVASKPRIPDDEPNMTRFENILEACR